MRKHSVDVHRVHHSVRLVVTLFVLLGFLVQNVAGSAYYSLLMEPKTTVTSPPVILQNGINGTSTIYTNSTSAEVSVSGYGYDFVDNNASNVDLSANIGSHSNFTAQKYGPDLINDTLTEGGTSPQTYQIHPTSFNDVSNKWSNEASAWDWNNATSATETQSKVTNDIYWITWNNSGSGKITDVDLRIRIDLTGLVDDYVTVEWWVGSTQGTGTYEINSTNDGSDLSISFDDLSEPNDGSWSWTDIGNIEIRQVGTQTSGPDPITYAVDEVWGWVNAGGYELDLEEQWTNVDYDETNEELCIKTGTFSGSEDIMVYARNVSTSDWDFLYNLTASNWNNVSVTDWLNNENFTVRFLGGTENSDTTEDSWNIDATLLHVWTETDYVYDYVLRVNNTATTESWQIKLKKYSDFNINRLQNCTIYFHNSTDGISRQIYIENGLYTQEEGLSWYDLDDSETIYIAMTATANSTATSYVRTYLEVLTPSTTTYAQYIITFEIT